MSVDSFYVLFLKLNVLQLNRLFVRMSKVDIVVEVKGTSARDWI